MNIDAAISQMNNLITALPPITEEATIAMAMNAKAMIQDRVQTTGMTATQMMSPYSKGYAAKRASKGKQTAFVDLTFTGEMFRTLEVTESGVTDNIGHATLYTKNALTARKLMDMEDIKRFTLDLNEQEKVELQNDFGQEMSKRIMTYIK